MKQIAFLFAGQGAQKPGMGRDLFEASAAARRVFEAADDVLGGRVTKLCFERPAEELNDTRNTQVALLAADLAAVAALTEQADIAPVCCAGFSLGEYAALVHAGVLPLREAFALVQKRAEFMSDCAPAGSGMAAILSLDAKIVEEICRETGAQSVNYNCPGQTVIAGLTTQLERAMEQAASRGGRAVVLPVSGAFHSTYMKKAGELLAQELSHVSLSDAIIPIYSNTTAKSVTSADDWKSLMSVQLCSPVLFEQSVRAMIERGVDTFVEFGPGGTLCGFLRRIDRTVKALRVEDTATLQAAISALKGED